MNNQTQFEAANFQQVQENGVANGLNQQVTLEHNSNNVMAFPNQTSESDTIQLQQQMIQNGQIQNLQDQSQIDLPPQMHNLQQMPQVYAQVAGQQIQMPQNYQPVTQQVVQQPTQQQQPVDLQNITPDNIQPPTDLQNQSNTPIEPNFENQVNQLTNQEEPDKDLQIPQEVTPTQPIKEDPPKEELLVETEEKKAHHIDANAFQIAMMNKMIPKAYKFDVLEVVQKQMELHVKKTQGLANFNSKKPLIANEQKQAKIYERYNQRRLREQQKLEQKQRMLIMNQEMEKIRQKKAIQDQEKQKESEAAAKTFKNDGKILKQNSMSVIDKDQSKKKSQKFDAGFFDEEEPKKALAKKEAQMFFNQKAGQFGGDQKQGNQPAPQDLNNTINPSMIQGESQNGEPIKKKRGRKPKDQSAQPQIKDQGKVDPNARIKKQKNKLSDKQSGSDNENPAGNFTVGQPNQGSENCMYDRYIKLLESMINHEELKNLAKIPQFLSPNEKQIQLMTKENGGQGYLNFFMIIQRLRSKKYGPGKNRLNEDQLQQHIKNVFKICRTYFSHDSQSLKVSRVLEDFFERKILTIHSDNQLNNDSNDRDKKKKDKSLKKDKKEKKMNKKRSRLERDSDDDGNSKSYNLQDQMKKKKMFENINNHLTVDQKKGIVAIIQPKVDGKPTQQKFEFDLFSVPDEQYRKLEVYVDKCMKENRGDIQKEYSKPEDQDDIQHQIDQKLKENEIQMDKFENNTDSQNEDSQKGGDKGEPFDPKKHKVKYYDLNETGPYNEDRHILIQKISSLENKQLKGILPIVKEYQSNEQATDEKLEFDLYELTDQKLKELHNYVEKCIESNQETLQKNDQEKALQEQMKLMRDQNQQHQYQNIMNEQIQYQQQLQQQLNQQQQLQEAQLGNQANADQMRQMLAMQMEQQGDPLKELIMRYYEPNDPNAQNLPIEQQDEADMNLKKGLVQIIQQLDKDLMSLFGAIVSSNQFKELDEQFNVQQAQQNGNQGQIELDITKLTNAQVRLLIKFLQDIEFQNQFKLIIQNQQATAQNQLSNGQATAGQKQLTPEEMDKMFATYDPNSYEQWLSQQKQNDEAQAQALQEVLNSVQTNLNEQLRHLNETTQLIQMLSQQQDAADPEKQGQLQQCAYNEQIIKENIINLQNYQEQQKNDYQFNLQQNLLLQAEKEATHKQYLQWIQMKSQQMQGNDQAQNLENGMAQQAQQVPEQAQESQNQNNLQAAQVNENNTQTQIQNQDEQKQLQQTQDNVNQEAQQTQQPAQNEGLQGMGNPAEQQPEQMIQNNDINSQLEQYLTQYNQISQEMEQRMQLSSQLQQYFVEYSNQLQEVQQLDQTNQQNKEQTQQLQSQIQNIQDQFNQQQQIIMQLDQNQELLKQSIGVLQQQQQSQQPSQSLPQQPLPAQEQQPGQQNPEMQPDAAQVLQQQDLNQLYLQQLQQQQQQMAQMNQAEQQLQQDIQNQEANDPNLQQQQAQQPPEQQINQSEILIPQEQQPLQTPFNTQMPANLAQNQPKDEQE